MVPRDSAAHCSGTHFNRVWMELTEEKYLCGTSLVPLWRLWEEAASGDRRTWRRLTTLEHPHSDVYSGWFPGYVPAPPGQSIWKLSPQIPGRSRCISVWSLPSPGGGRETSQSSFFILQRRKPLVVVQMQLKSCSKLDFMETHEIWLVNITLPTDEVLIWYKSFSLLVTGALGCLMDLAWSLGYHSEQWTGSFTIWCTHDSPCENTTLFCHSFQWILEMDSVHITLTVKSKHSVINIQTVYYILSLYDSATLSFSR